jgi:hypothetical protein
VVTIIVRFLIFQFCRMNSYFANLIISDSILLSIVTLTVQSRRCSVFLNCKENERVTKVPFFSAQAYPNVF